MLGLVQMVLPGGARDLLVGVVVDGVGRNSIVSTCGSTSMATIMGAPRAHLGQGLGLVHQQQSAAKGSFPSCSPGMAGDAAMGTSYGGDANRDSVADAG